MQRAKGKFAYECQSIPSSALEVAARTLALSTVSLIVDFLSKVDGTVLHARNFALDVVCSVKKALEVEAEQDECAARDFACTLLVAVVDQHRATFWQIGHWCHLLPASLRNRSGKEEVFRVGYVVGWVFGVIIATIRAGLLMRI